jgi:hypothetical protein
MCKEAVQTILNRASSEPGYLKAVYSKPKVTLDGHYALTPEEKSILLSGSLLEIEACVGRPLSPFLQGIVKEAAEAPSKRGEREREEIHRAARDLR